MLIIQRPTSRFQLGQPGIEPARVHALVRQLLAPIQAESM